MIKKDGFEFPDWVEAEGVILKRDNLLSFGHEVNEFPDHILKMFVASVVVYHSLDDPAISDLVVEVAPVNPFEEWSWIRIENCPIGIFDVRFHMLKNY